MNRIVKTFAFLTVLTASFVYAQDEVDDVKGKDAKTIGVDAEQKANTVTPKVKPTTEAKVKMKSHEQCDNCSKDVGKSEALKKGSFWSRIFGGKSKKEDDPN
tara:strand:- start:746 stop:1051 length:306 start_codon:yes stop_codon:yes gene_type:complete